MSTKIEWCNETWNPMTGCTPKSKACEKCYAKRIAEGLGGRFGYPLSEPFRPGVIHENQWHKPYQWKKPRRIFVCSMGDLFHDAVPDWAIFAVWQTIWQNFHHTFMILTKRPERMRDWFRKLSDCGPPDVPPVMYRKGLYVPHDINNEQLQSVINSGRGKMFHDWVDSLGEPPAGCAAPTYDWMDGPRWWQTFPENLWLGVSVEDDQTANERIPILLDVGGRRNFLSVEPMLEGFDVSRFMAREPYYMTKCEYCGWIGTSELCGEGSDYHVKDEVICPSCSKSIRGDDAPGIEWVICGSQTGPSRPPNR